MSKPSRRSTPLPPDWRRTRQRILDRDGFLCQRCRQWANHVDHITPAYAGGGDEDSNLQSLCYGCHASKTGREARAASLARSAARRRSEPKHPGLRG